MRFSRALLVAASSLAVLTLSACGSTTAGEAEALAASIEQAMSAATEQLPALQSAAAEAAEAAEAAASVATSTRPEEPPVTRTVAKTGWYGGFSVTVDQVTATPGYGDGVELTVDVTYTNLGTVPADAPRPTALVDGEILEGLDDLPAIPGAGSASGSVVVGVSRETESTGALPSFDDVLDRLTLMFGDAGDNQTTIPIAPDEAVESIEPKDLEVSGTLAQAEIIAEVSGGSLVPSYQTGEGGTMLLNLSITLTCAADCPASGYYVDRSDFSVTAPDGSSVLPDQRSGFCCEAVYPDTVSDDVRNVLTFTVAAPGTGRYVLSFANQTVAATGAAASALPFTA